MTTTAFVSTYPPRRCGIATFTHDLSAAAAGHEIVALIPPSELMAAYPSEVHHRIRRDERGDYRRVARALSDCVDVVSVQHEYGIWGGEDGEYVLDFVRALEVPAVATLHTVLRNPTFRQRTILSELVDATAATVVMSRSAATLLAHVYGANPNRLDVIPHGVPDLPLADPASMKPLLGLDGRPMILSFGLLGPGKGYELAIDALPAVVADHPTACFVVVGATHPNLVARDGEAYRDALTARADALGVLGHLRFVNRFVSKRELTGWLQAADVFVTPYPNLDQIVSGTLSYAMGAGRAIVSTPYAYAAELLAEGRGVLVQAGSPPHLAAALSEVLGDHELRAAIGKRAYAHSRSMVWPAVGAAYRRLFARISTPIGVQTIASPMAALRA